MPDDDREPGRSKSGVLSSIAAAGALLFIVAVASIVILQTLLPALGMQAGSPSEWVIFSMMVWALIVLGFLPAAAIFRKKGDDE
jgi:hypothetical protein